MGCARNRAIRVVVMAASIVVPFAANPPGTASADGGPLTAADSAVPVGPGVNGRSSALPWSVGSTGPGVAERPNHVSAVGHGGVLDRSFGTRGKVTTDFAGLNDLANALVVQLDGKLVAAGGSSADFGLARYHANGSLDTSFGTGGLITTARPW